MVHFVKRIKEELNALAGSSHQSPEWSILSKGSKKLTIILRLRRPLPTSPQNLARSEVSSGHMVSYIVFTSAQKQLPEPQEHAKSSKTLEKDHSEVSIGHGISKLKCGDQWTPPSGLFRVFLMILLKCGDQWTPPSGLCRRFSMILPGSSDSKPK